MMGPFEQMVERKWTITKAAKALAAKGHQLMGTADYDLKNKTAKYRVRVNGREKILTPQEIERLIA